MTWKRYDEDFKRQIVKIYNQGNHSYRSFGDEYGVTATSIRTWVLRYNSSNSFKETSAPCDEESMTIKYIKVFHSDRGNEYHNTLIDNILSTFKIEKSLSNR